MSEYVENSEEMKEIVDKAAQMASKMHHEFVMPEHLLNAMIDSLCFTSALHLCGLETLSMKQKLLQWLNEQERTPKDETHPRSSEQLLEAMTNAFELSLKNNEHKVRIFYYAVGILQLEDSYAAYILGSEIGEKQEEFLGCLDLESKCFEMAHSGIKSEDIPIEEPRNETWKTFVSDISELAKTHTPLIGREQELERTIQVLCRMEKNNALHIGDPGVGKSAIIYGLANMISNGNVPERLKGYKIYGADMGQLLAGTQYRGDFEKKLKMILDGASGEKAIIYLDEIHNIMGAGRLGNSSVDASNMLKPYLEAGKLRFVGATTYEDYNRQMAKDHSITRRFQTIDIKEPSVEETIKILQGLQPMLQKYHNVVYRKGTIEYAVKASAKHITDRKLPDKAIDLIDEAGAYLELHPQHKTKQYVTKTQIDAILTKVCNIQANALTANGEEHLANLKDNILKQIYGQDEAVDKLTSAVMMAKAGLNEEGKPLASLLFVGPTGVGKTKVARVLAKEMGVELVRFDMSEYAEKHTVAKLIGSPAGYVGYDDGGLLTNAVRKSPNCVLLLDEIEKAHSDIYNILLQIMDYATLTDSRGEKTDFRNVIFIMTSNAGAQYAAQASIGFAGGVSKGTAMMKQVKKTFKPEFINRLNDIVVFNDMDRTMASLILRKKLGELEAKLLQKDVQMTVSDEAFDYLLTKCFTPEYGGRETDRVITRELKQLFMKEILFGKLNNGGDVMVDLNDNKIYLANED